MALKFSVPLRNARLDVMETTIGALPIMKFFTGAAPANCAAADSGTTLATLTLPSDWAAAASGGAKALAGTWQDTSADNSGTVGHWRIYDPTGVTCHMQGTATASGGGGDVIVDNVVFASGQQFTVTAFTITDGNA